MYYTDGTCIIRLDGLVVAVKDSDGYGHADGTRTLTTHWLVLYYVGCSEPYKIRYGSAEARDVAFEEISDLLEEKK